MATSSIFTNIIIDTPEKAERFVNALEESSKDPEWKSDGSYRTITDPDEIRTLTNKMLKRTKRR